MATETWSGGCQCGAVRYELSGPPRNPLICHCRMCQKHVGGPFGAFAETEISEFVLTRGVPSAFRSSDAGERLFCRDCGTPLGFRYHGQPLMAVTIASLDRHAEVRPEVQYMTEQCAPWLADIARLPLAQIDAATLAVIEASNKQHPDHDTLHWPESET